jgi:hypothetical protein
MKKKRKKIVESKCSSFEFISKGKKMRFKGSTSKFVGKTKKLVNLNMDVKHPDSTWHNFSQCNNIGF